MPGIIVTMIRITMAVILLTVWAAVAWGDDLFPGRDGIVLRDGDILLNYGPTPLGSFNRIFSTIHGPYSHAMAYVKSPGQDGRIVDFSSRGLKLEDPETVLKRLYRVALIRPRTPPEPGRLEDVLKRMQDRYAKGELTFDFAMKWRETDDGCFYCTEFLSQLYRQAGACDPFPLVPYSGDAPWIHWVETTFGIDAASVVSPNTPLVLPQFDLIAEYRHPSGYLLRRATILDTILECFQEYLDHGETLRQPYPGSRLLIGLAGLGAFDQGLLGGLPEESRPELMMALEFVTKVQHRVERTVYLDAGEDWPVETLTDLTRRTALAYKARYFVSVKGR